VSDEDALKATISAFQAGTGPVAIDAERASGYRYSQRAYLVQLRREGVGTALIDPRGVPDLSDLGAVLADTEWVLHAASQDLPCLDEVGMRPTSLFDTELAARLLGKPKVGLGTLVEEILGFTLEKGHSAADWSTRPLPEDWLRYAALDVELLLELREALEAELREAEKLQWAYEEFEAVRTAGPREPRVEPWRRTSGLHRVRDRRKLAAVRSLWEARDDLAQRRDVAPTRVLPDAAIIDAVLAAPRTKAGLLALAVYRGRSQRREADRWFQALDEARQVPDDELPAMTAVHDGPPPARTWASREPDAADRLAAARAAVAEVGEANNVPVENLLTPDSLRRVVWDPPRPPTAEAVADALRERGARDWQVALTAEVVADAISAPLASE
jgi:ribonuclease D